MAVAIGIAGVWAARRAGVEKTARVMLPLTIVALSVTLASEGLDGVHRWITLGPLRLDASSALTPWLFVSFHARDTWVARRIVAAAIVAAQAIHIAQPDAARATALAAGALPLLLSRGVLDRATSITTALLTAGLSVVAWSRPDRLAPVEHVERILAITAADGPLWSLAACAAGLAAFAPFLAAAFRESVSRSSGPHPRGDMLGTAFVALFSGALISTCFGHFPVPLFGAGAGPVLGWYAALSGLALRHGSHEAELQRR